jgi:filamentous hemagglutinin family protein
MTKTCAIGFWALLLAGAPIVATGSVFAGEVASDGGPMSLGTAVNGVVGGSCTIGQCQISGGTAAGGNLFHRLSAFDTQGAVTGVNVNTGGLPNVFMAVTNPAGSFIDKLVTFSGPTNLVWLSPGGISLSGAGGFLNVQQLNLSTATGWRVGAGVFDAAGTTAVEAALLNGTPVHGLAGAVTNLAAGDLSLAGGLLTVNQDLLLDAQGGNVLLQAAGIESQAGSVVIQGQSVLQAAPVAGASVEISAAGTVLNSAPIQASGSVDAAASITVRADEAVVQTASALLDASSGGLRGTVSVQAGERLFSSASIFANGTGVGQAVGGTIEILAPSVTLVAAQLEASGPAGGGTVLVSSSNQAANVSNQTTVNASTTLRADATAVGPGGQITVSSDGTTTYRGTASARGSGSGGDGGEITLSGKERLVYGGQADASAPQGSAGRLVLDLNNIVIQAEAPGVSYDVLTLGSPFSGSGNGFAKDVLVLQGGNIVATDPYSDAFGTDSGAVYADLCPHRQ